MVFDWLFGSKHKKRAKELEAEVESLEEQNAELEAEIERLKGEREELQSELSDTGAVDELQAELDTIKQSQAQFEVYEDAGGKYRWRLRHRNGKIVATSGQGFSRKHNAKKGIASTRRNSVGADLLEIVPEAEEDADEALAEAPLILEEAEDSNAEFELYEDEAGDYRWRLVHDNGNIIAEGGQGYASKQKAKQGLQSVKSNAGEANYLTFDPASFEIYRDEADEWRWRLLHQNGNIVAAPTDGHSRRRGAKREIEAARAAIRSARNRFHVYEDDGGEYRWQLRGENGDLVATSGEGYSKRADAVGATDRVKAYIAAADALDIGSAAFEVYKDNASEWRWRLRHRNGNIIATGGEGYSRRSSAHDAIEGVKINVPGANVVDG